MSACILTSQWFVYLSLVVNYQKYLYSLPDKGYNRYKDLARSLHLLHSFEDLADLASKCNLCKNITGKCNPCKIFQGNTFLARSCKEISYLQGSCKMLSTKPRKMHYLVRTCKILARKALFPARDVMCTETNRPALRSFGICWERLLKVSTASTTGGDQGSIDALVHGSSWLFD